eukprot:scaffold234002_cov24-Attheya_sp.AAC.1
MELHNPQDRYKEVISSPRTMSDRLGARAVAFYVVPTRKTTNEIFYMTSIAPGTGSFLDRQQGRTRPGCGYFGTKAG